MQRAMLRTKDFQLFIMQSQNFGIGGLHSSCNFASSSGARRPKFYSFTLMQQQERKKPRKANGLTKQRQATTVRLRTPSLT